MCHQENNCVCLSVYICHGGFISTCEATFIRQSVLFGVESILFLLVTACSVIALAATSKRTGKVASVCCGDRSPGYIRGRHQHEIIFLS